MTVKRNLRRRRLRIAPVGAALCAVMVTATVGLAGCGPTQKSRVAVPSSTNVPEAEINLEKAAAENRSNFYAEKFAGKVEVLTEESGVDAVRMFFDESETLIVADGEAASQLRAASIAVAQHAPMVVYTGDNRAAIASLAHDLGVNRVFIVGNVPYAAQSGSIKVEHDPGTQQALGVVTAFQFTSKVVANPEQAVQEVAALDPDAKVELKAAWQPMARDESVDPKSLSALPAQSRRDADQAPVIIAAPSSPISAVATVRAFGGSIRVMPTGDPRDSKAAFAMVAGLEDGPLVALGQVFETSILLRDRIRQGWKPAS